MTLLLIPHHLRLIKKIIRCNCVPVFLILVISATGFAQDNNPNLGIIPAPVSVKKMNGNFIFSSHTRIISDNPNEKAVNYLKEFLKTKWFADSKQTFKTNSYFMGDGDATRSGSHGLVSSPTGNKIKNSKQTFKADSYFMGGEDTAHSGLPRLVSSPTDNTLVLTSAGTDSFKEEEYHLTITPEKIIIAGKPAGLFYGMQTFIQLCNFYKKEAIAKIPCAVIEDYPRFAYRGFMLDVSRHFFPEPFIKQTLDWMAGLKLNTFHWHLTDSEGWRIEIDKYPKLTSVGGFSIWPFTGGSPAGVGGYHDGLDSISRGGFYTKEQIREIIKYAADRYITIIPEIEMPGHSRAALRAYPELMCKSMVQPPNEFNSNTYCPTEETFHFLEGVLSEVIDLFPGKYIHIGGDEVNKMPWKESAFCQQLIKKLNLKNEDGLQSYFMKRIEQYVNSKGKTIIGWDEMLEGGIAPNAVVMSWRGEQGGIEAAKQKHYVIMTPGSEGMYFDNAQSHSPEEPPHIGFYAPLQKTYSYNPVPSSLNKEERKYILGVQANLWTEFISTPAKVEYMIFPRLYALSEVAWSPPDKKDFKDFSTVRLPKHLAALDKQGIDFRVPIPVGISDTTFIGHKFIVSLKPPIPNAKIYYTVTGYKPGDTDPVYEDSLTFLIPEGQTRELQTRVITPSGRRSVSTKLTMRNIAPLQSVNDSSAKPGLFYQLYKDELLSKPQVNNQNIEDTGTIKTIDLSKFKTQKAVFGLSLQGYIKIEEEGICTFYLQSAGDAKMFIDDDGFLDNDKNDEMQKASLPLTKGLHKIKINSFNSDNVLKLKILMAANGKMPHDISSDMLFH